MPATMREIIAAYEHQSAGMPQRWRDLPPERWNGTLEFFGNQRPAAPMAWSFLFDLVHHRGQMRHLSKADGIDRAADLRAERR